MVDAFSQTTDLRDALGASGDLAYHWNVSSDAITWSEGAALMLAPHDPAATNTGTGLARLVHRDDHGLREEAWRDSASGGQFDSTFRILTETDRFRWFHDRGVVIRDGAGQLTDVRGVMREIGSVSMGIAELNRVATHDPLTGHFNRARLGESLSETIQYRRRYGGSGTFLAVGIDKMTVVNEAYGVDVADQVVLTVGERLERSLRSADVIGRIDGDRFGVVLANCQEDEIPEIAEKTLESVRQSDIECPAGTINVTVSIGAVSFPEIAATVNDVVNKGEIALRDAKVAGRDCYSIYVSNQAQQREHRDAMVIAKRVQVALRENRMLFAYQPVVSSRTREPIMYECLLRIRETDGQLVPAAKFMPVVEQRGMIRPVDRLALDLAVAALDCDPVAHLALNVSGLTTTDRSWLRAAVVLLRPRRLIAERLVIEITETAGLEDLDVCAHFIAILRDLGCRVALDDFGAGYTSFRNLRQLDVDQVKLDGSFVRTMQESHDSLVFVRTLVELAHGCGLETVAECVETEEVADMLTREGVDYLQGYVFGAPDLASPAEQSARFAAARASLKAQEPAVHSRGRRRTG